MSGKTPRLQLGVQAFGGGANDYGGERCCAVRRASVHDDQANRVWPSDAGLHSSQQPIKTKITQLRAEDRSAIDAKTKYDGRDPDPRKDGSGLAAGTRLLRSRQCEERHAVECCLRRHHPVTVVIKITVRVAARHQVHSTANMLSSVLTEPNSKDARPMNSKPSFGYFSSLPAYGLV